MHCTVHKNTAQLWQTEHLFLSNQLTLPTRFGKSFRNRVTNILIHVISCMIFHWQLFVSVFAMNARMFRTVSLITSTYPLLNSDFAFSAVSANTMNNSHHRQSVINFVSWMKATEMGLITHSMRRPVNMCKTLSFRDYIKKKIKSDYEFCLQGNFQSNYKLWNSFCVQVIILRRSFNQTSFDIHSLSSFLEWG